MLALLDIDGTLVDTNYHHAIAWFRGFRDHDITLPIWQIHRHIGMGGDQLVAAVSDEQTDERLGDQIRDAHAKHYDELIGEVRTMAGSRELIDELVRRGHRVVFASSAKAEEADVYLDLLGVRDAGYPRTTSADVETTKPSPDLVHAALEKGEGKAEEAVLIGDSTWDIEAAKQAGVPTLAVLTGGFSAQELTDAGAVAVFESVAELCERLDETALR